VRNSRRCSYTKSQSNDYVVGIVRGLLDVLFKYACVTPSSPPSTHFDCTSVLAGYCSLLFIVFR
jgi:hypothetical protein